MRRGGDALGVGVVRRGLGRGWMLKMRELDSGVAECTPGRGCAADAGVGWVG